MATMVRVTLRNNDQSEPCIKGKCDSMRFHLIELHPFFNMANFAVVCTIVVIACLGLSYAAPFESHGGSHGLRKDDMAEKFVEFMKQDHELSNLLAEMSDTHAGLVRNRRANSMDDVESVDDTTVTGTSEGGFFDRATRFVMEILQRFMRWINTDE